MNEIKDQQRMLLGPFFFACFVCSGALRRDCPEKVALVSARATLAGGVSAVAACADQAGAVSLVDVGQL